MQKYRVQVTFTKGCVVEYKTFDKDVVLSYNKGITKLISFMDITGLIVHINPNKILRIYQIAV